jgi:hypothetical protein
MHSKVLQSENSRTRLTLSEKSESVPKKFPQFLASTLGKSRVLIKIAKKRFDANLAKTPSIQISQQSCASFALFPQQL